MEFESKYTREPKEGLGEELNAEIARSLTKGDYIRILEIISDASDKHLASEVVVNSMFESNTGNRAESVNNLINAALNNVDENKNALLALIRYAYKDNATTERFWQNPETGEILYIDDDGEVVLLKGEIDNLDGTKYVTTLTNYTVLTGPNAGHIFHGTDNSNPAYRPIKGDQME